MFRLRFGGNHRGTMALAKKLGFTLTGVGARGEIDERHRIANQSARPTVHRVRNLMGAPVHTQLGSDTLGAKFPASAAGNQFVQTWSIIDNPDGRRNETGEFHVTFSPDHTAASSVRGLKQFAHEAAIPMGPAINSSTRLYLDGGSEYKGVFAGHAAANGVDITTTTANKTSKMSKTYVEENNNRIAQALLREGLGDAANNFASIGLNARDYWDRCIKYQVYKRNARPRIMNTAGATEIERATMLELAVPAPFGARGSRTLQPTSPGRAKDHKQLAPRATVELLIGMNGDKKIMLRADGTVVGSVDVKFADDCMLPRIHTADHGRGDVQLDDVIPNLLNVLDDTDGGDYCDKVSFPAADGTAVMVGDRASIYWPAGQQTYYGEIVDIDYDDKTATGGTYSVEYDGNDPGPYPHPIDESGLMQVKVLSLKVGGGRLRHKPHPTVARFVDDNGDILEGVLNGTIELPSKPTLKFTRSTAPDVPKTVPQALSTPEALSWLHGVVAEWQSHTQPDERGPATWVNVDCDTDANVMNGQWVMCWKFIDDAPEKAKARFVACGVGQTQGGHYKDAHVPLPPPDDQADLDYIALQKGWYTYEIDNSNAYCWALGEGSPNGKPKAVAFPRGTRQHRTTPDGGLKRQHGQLQMGLYGDPPAGSGWAATTHRRITNRDLLDSESANPIKFEQSKMQPCIFYADLTDTEWAGEYLIAHEHNDNLRVYASAGGPYIVFRDWWRNEYKTTGGDVPLQAMAPQASLGMTLTYKPDAPRRDMPAYVNKLLADCGMTDCKPTKIPITPGFDILPDDPPTEAEQQDILLKVNEMFAKTFTSWAQVVTLYRSMVSGIGWPARMVAPMLATAHSILGRCMHNPCLKAFKAMKQTPRFLKGNPDIGIIYHKTREFEHDEFPEYNVSTDSSFGIVCQGGFVAGFEDQPPTAWGSTKTKKKCLSSFEAESEHAAEGARHLMYKHQLWNEIGFNIKFPYKFYVDNRAVFLHNGGTVRHWSPRSKHHSIESRFLADLNEQRIVDVTHKHGNDFPVDAMTKPLPRELFSRYYARLHGPAAP